ncbi:paxillin homolog 1 isoform X1 [Tribolium madens]|uniref:paxillin homolog 1 isoform X1 n=1 Tax=Tribolium madens TaxID=41895 RepID=UPI001CF73CD5|nr:paxillin homolog 1 isoform X1 [Tribolium madens]
MGLLLSVLVACVGVVELLAFYSNVTRNFVTTSTQTNLPDLTKRYLQDLEKLNTTTRQISSEDIELEVGDVVTRSRSSTPKRFLLTEKEDHDRSRSPTPRRFIVTNANGENSNLPKFIVEEKNSTQKQFKIKKDDTVFPLPKEFIVTPHSRSPSPIPRRFGEQQEVIFRRSPSPYPNPVLPVPRNSICSELLENPTLSVVEVDEEQISRSPTPEKLDLILESKHDSTEYWTNKMLVVPRSKSRESSKSASPCSSRTPEEFDEQFLDSLDGVKRSKLSRSSSSRKSRKRNKAPINNESKDDCLSSSDAQTAKTLTEAANVLKSVNREDAPSGSSAGPSNGDSKTTEPFWLIFSGEYTKAMNKDWHGQHFCCWQCDESLTGQRYVLRDDHPYCVSCYESVFANACEKCSRIIGIDSKDLSYKDKHWHEACFLCTTCGESLVDRQFGSKGDRIYCGRCYDEQFASRCDGCHEIFRAGTKKMEYKTRQWHEKCFCCCVCKVPIGTQSFIPREQEIYCAKCYEEKFATRCIKCNKVITSGGVTYKNEPWHRECFTCTHCSKSLAGERFTSRDEKPYCAECFGELFAKRCFACNKPITGIGGTKFISFEDRHWHNDCFFCASCRTSLVGRGFITDQDDIICPECAKQKLM